MTQVFRKVNHDCDKQHLQKDPDKLVKWSEKWQMLLNFGKCKCLHTGHGNVGVNCEMGDTVLGTTKTWRLRGDQIEVFKILNGYEYIVRNICSHSRKTVELEDMR